MPVALAWPWRVGTVALVYQIGGVPDSGSTFGLLLLALIALLRRKPSPLSLVSLTRRRRETPGGEEYAAPRGIPEFVPRWGPSFRGLRLKILTPSLSRIH